MGIQLCIDLLVLILFIYYITIGLHFMGLSIYVKLEVKAEKTVDDATVLTETKTDEKEKLKKFEISFWKSLIPFFYWFKRETTI